MTGERASKPRMVVYISGKETGISIEHVVTKFRIAESFINSIGMTAINPLNNGLNESHSKEEHLVKDLELLLTANTIFILENWSTSKQSRIEKKIAEEQGMQIMYESNTYKNYGGIEMMKDAISKVMNLSFKDYITESRKKEFFYARMILVYYCRNVENMNLHEIGDLINRDHTTVLHALKTYKKDIMYNAPFRKIANDIQNALNE